MSEPTRAESAAGAVRWRWVGLFAALLCVRLLTLLPAVIDDDEGFFAASANALSGPRSFFLRALDDKPPGTVWFDAAVRWISGPLHLAQWSRLAGLLVLGVTAVLVARIARTGASEEAPRGRPGGWAAALFLVATGAFTPKLFALTNEQLLLAPLTLAVLAAVDGTLAPRAVRWVIAGAALGVATWIKQTAVLFLLPVLLACDGLGAGVAVLAAFGLTALAGAASVGLHDDWRWTVVYPREVLIAARRTLFAGWRDGAENLLLFGVALSPLLARAFQGARRAHRGAGGAGKSGRERKAWVMAAWLGSALVAVALGKALFPHYLLLALPPLAIVAGRECARAPLRRWQRIWLGVAYVGCALCAAWPLAHLFWGNDLPYFTRVARRMTQLSTPADRVLLWGGSPVPLAISGRVNATRFVTSRFLVPPYEDPATTRLFREDFQAHPPALVVDLHARGDNQQNLPPASIAWLGAALARDYRVWADPALPWARFYVRAEGLPSSSSSRLSTAGLCPSAPLDDARSGYPHALGELMRALAVLRRPPRPTLRDLAWLEVRLRVAFSQEVLATSCPALGASPGSNADAGLSAPAVQDRFTARGFASPLPLEGPRFWVELAIVELQPVIRPRPDVLIGPKIRP